MAGGDAALQEALRGDHARSSSAVFRDAFTGQTTALALLSGTVTVDVGATNRRMLAATLPPQQSVFDLLASPGGEITVTTTIRFNDGITTRVVPMGVFCVTQTSLSARPDGSIGLRCPDRWYRVASAGFGLARSSISTNAAWQEVKRLIEGAWPNAAYPFPGWAAPVAGLTNPDQSATAKAGALIWDDGDRDVAIAEFLKANSLDAYFDASGLAVLRPIPTLTAASIPVWTVKDGPGGILKDAERQRDGSAVRNVIMLRSSASDIILPMVEVANTRSPLVDQLSSLGPLGRRTLEVTSPAFRSTAQMTAAGKTILSKQLSAQIQLDATTATSNPYLDGYDVLGVVLPLGDGATRPTEQHLIETVTHPLTADGEQEISVRATRSTADDTV